MSYLSSSLSLFSTLLVIGGEYSESTRATWSTPTHLLHWVNYTVSIITINFFSFCKFFFGDHHWVLALFYIYHMTSFNYDAKEERDVGLSYRCHPSNIQIVHSVKNMLERKTCLWLCVSLCVCFCCYCYIFDSVFLFVSFVLWSLLLFVFWFLFLRVISLNNYVIEAVTV